jgi:very-short-patch-repair endonuclease
LPIGRYIADFACIEAKLVIELDGSQHQQQAVYDKQRSSEIESRGFQIIRFWDNQIFQETQAVLEAILKALSPP